VHQIKKLKMIAEMGTEMCMGDLAGDRSGEMMARLR
jgi:hypothetical protein